MNKDIFWSKKQDNNGIFKWLPLRQHLRDVAYICDRLWEHWLSRGQRQLIINALDGNNTNPKSLINFIALTHDLGKASYAFQTKDSIWASQDLNLALIEKLEKNGFDGITSAMLPEDPGKTPHALAAQALLISFGVNEDIATLIGGHHGKPIDRVQKSFLKRIINGYPVNFYQSESNLEVNKLWKSAQENLFFWALEESGYENVSDLPKIESQSAQFFLSGLLIMADWIASNENYFPLIDIDEDKVEDIDQRSKEAWKKWHKTFAWESKYSDFENLYSERFEFENPKEEQEIFSRIVEETEEPGIFIFEAPMGLGKTEAALVAVEQLAKKTDKSGMFFGLPTQATSNGMFSRVKEWLEKIAEEDFETYPIRLSHGKAALNEDFSKFRKSENCSKDIDVDGEKDSSLRVNEWFSGRKTAVLDDFVVGTVDQFLMMALKQKHLALRHLGFSRKVVVLDEVHAYDVYMSQYLYQAISWAATYKIPIVILSATLPANQRRWLINSYMSGLVEDVNELDFRLVDLNTDAYPLITYNDGLQIKQHVDFPKKKDKNFEIKKIDSEQIFEEVERISKSKGIIGIIVNTVRKSQELVRRFAKIYGDDKVDLFHSSFIATDRVRKEKDLLDAIGKNGDRPEFKIIIGTQVIEQSLDIDFDVMISDLAPMDLLIQRLGRLHRHDRIRPQGHEYPKVYVMGTSSELEFEEGSKLVYGGYILARTQYFLPEHVKIPSDISKLVQKVYSEEDLGYEGDLLDKYNRYKNSYLSSKSHKEKRAMTYRLSDPILFKPRRSKSLIIDLLSESGSESWAKSKDEGASQVRDIQETIEVIAVRKIGNGYSTFDNRIDISKEIDDFSVAKDLSKHTLRLPMILSIPKNIDATIKELEIYNIKHFSNWQNSSWLKGSLGIMFEDNEFELNGYKLKYDEKYGLSYERRDNGTL